MQKLKGLTHFFHAATYSWDGFKALCGEAAFRQELLLGVVVLPLAWLLPHLSLLWRVMLTCAWVLMLAAEALNTAIEAVVDMVMPERHPLAKKAKDLGSFTVLCLGVVNIIVWIAAIYIIFQ